MTWPDRILIAYSLGMFLAGMFFSGTKKVHHMTKKSSSRLSGMGARRLENQTHTTREHA